MNILAKLTKRESEIAELFAWVQAKKMLQIAFSFRNVPLKTTPEIYMIKSGVIRSTSYRRGGFARNSISHSVCHR